MVKAYLRYEQAAAFGVIASNSNMVFTKDGSTLATASLEAVSLWSVRQAALVSLIVDDLLLKAQLTPCSKQKLVCTQTTHCRLDPTLSAVTALSRLRMPVQYAEILAGTSEVWNAGIV